MLHFYTPEVHFYTFGFLRFPERKEMEDWREIGWQKLFYKSQSS